MLWYLYFISFLQYSFILHYLPFFLCLLLPSLFFFTLHSFPIFFISLTLIHSIVWISLICLPSLSFQYYFFYSFLLQYDSSFLSFRYIPNFHLISYSFLPSLIVIFSSLFFAHFYIFSTLPRLYSRHNASVATLTHSCFYQQLSLFLLLLFMLFSPFIHHFLAYIKLFELFSFLSTHDKLFGSRFLLYPLWVAFLYQCAIKVQNKHNCHMRNCWRRVFFFFYLVLFLY